MARGNIAVYQPPNLDGVELSSLRPFPPKIANAASAAEGTSGTLAGPALRNEAEHVAQVITAGPTGNVSPSLLQEAITTRR